MTIKSLVLFVLLGLAPFVNAASVYWLGPNHENQVVAGDTFFLDVNLLREDAVLGGFDANIYYDPTAFILSGGYFGGALGGASESIQEWNLVQEGDLHLMNISFLSSPSLAQLQSPPSNLFVLNFTARSSAAGVYSFLVNVNEAVSASGAPLVIDNMSGQIQVVPLPAGIGFLLVGMSGLLGFVRRRVS